MWVGESGILTVVIGLVVIVAVVRLWPLRQMLVSPHQPLLPEIDLSHEEYKVAQA